MKKLKNKYYVNIKKRILLYSLAAFFLLILIMIFAVSTGSANISLSQILKLLLNEIPLVKDFLHAEDINPLFKYIFFEIRLPRIMLAVIVGMALSGAGVMYQGLFKNPMADSYIVGVSPGALLGATFAIVFSSDNTILGLSGIIFFSFAGALLVSLLVFNIGQLSKHRSSILTLILAGLAIGALCNAISSFFRIIASQEQMHRLIFWIMGSFTSSTWLKAGFSASVVLSGSIALFFYTRDLNLFSLGEDRAKQLGINTTVIKTVILCVASLNVAAAVSVSGLIAFVGIIVPHIMRLLVGSDNRVLFPVSLFAGGALMLLADTIARDLIAPREIPVGIITSLIGSPFFIWLLLKSRKRIEF